MTIYPTYYYAKKAATADDKVVKVDGGYAVMSIEYYYNVWRKQK